MSYLDRQNYIMQSIAQQYTNSLKTKSVNISSMVTNQLNINCGEKCKDCLNLFLTDSELTGENYLKNKSFIDYIRNNTCSPLCICNLNSIIQDSTLIFTPDSSITTEDINTDEITNNVLEDIQSKYNYTPDTKNIKNIIVSIQEKVVQNINQLITSSNVIELTGAGSLNNIKVVSSINAVMNAIVTNKDSVTSISNIVNNMVSDIQKEVTEKVNVNIKNIILQNSGMLIGLGSLVGILFIIIIVLLVIKATR